MNTAMSTKRTFISNREEVTPRSHEVQYAVYALLAGLMVMIVGIQASINIFMVAGFFAAVCAGLALNSMFWASYFSKHPERLSMRKFDDRYNRYQ